jgi:hypothetical protein
MVLSWLDTREVDAFADAVVKELIERFPPAGVDLSTRKSVDRVMRNVERLLVRVTEFTRERKLNVYKKARFGNRVKWALKEANYPPQFVDIMTHKLVEKAALASAKERGR